MIISINKPQLDDKMKSAAEIKEKICKLREDWAYTTDDIIADQCQVQISILEWVLDET